MLFINNRSLNSLAVCFSHVFWC